MRSRKLKQLKTTMIFLVSQRFQVVLEAKTGNAFSGEISLEKMYFNLVHLKTQGRVFFNDCYYFFASILGVPMVLEELILWKTDMLA